MSKINAIKTEEIKMINTRLWLEFQRENGAETPEYISAGSFALKDGRLFDYEDLEASNTLEGNVHIELKNFDEEFSSECPKLLKDVLDIGFEEINTEIVRFVAGKEEDLSAQYKLKSMVFYHTLSDATVAIACPGQYT